MSEPVVNTVNVVLLGPPGAGKSTIAEAIAEHYNLITISTGQRLRAEVEARSMVGRAVKDRLDRGELVPDSLMDRLLRSGFESFDPDRGFLLDGYPRTMRQAIGLFAMLADYGRHLDAVLALDVDDEEVVRRLSGRRICEGPLIDEPFPIHIDDLASMLRCRERGGRAVQREDDRADVVRQRLLVYHEQTQPLLAYYRAEALLVSVSALGRPAEVARRAENVLQTAIQARI